jgi:putative flippase GtrA
MNKKSERLFVFGKAQVSALLGGFVDYVLMISVTEILGVHYVISIAIGGIAGAAVNFSLNRKWTFHKKDQAYLNSGRNQISKFLLVLMNSIMLKSSGTYFFTAFMGIDYKISRLMTDLIVSMVFNFTLQKFWVFKREGS